MHNHFLISRKFKKYEFTNYQNLFKHQNNTNFQKIKK